MIRTFMALLLITGGNMFLCQSLNVNYNVALSSLIYSVFKQSL